MGQRYIVMGPYQEKSIDKEIEQCDFDKDSVLAKCVDKLRYRGFRVVTGRWLVEGRPLAILFDIDSVWWAFERYRHEIIVDNGIHLPRDPMTRSVVQFGFMVAQFLADFHAELVSSSPLPSSQRNLKVVAHFHEWLSGVGLMLVRQWKVPVGTIFTTHATILGRHLCAAGKDLCNDRARVVVLYKSLPTSQNKPLWTKSATTTASTINTAWSAPPPIWRTFSRPFPMWRPPKPISCWSASLICWHPMDCVTSRTGSRRNASWWRKKGWTAPSSTTLWCVTWATWMQTITPELHFPRRFNIAFRACSSGVAWRCSHSHPSWQDLLLFHRRSLRVLQQRSRCLHRIAGPAQLHAADVRPWCHGGGLLLLPHSQQRLQSRDAVTSRRHQHRRRHRECWWVGEYQYLVTLMPPAWVPVELLRYSYCSTHYHSQPGLPGRPHPHQLQTL